MALETGNEAPRFDDLPVGRQTLAVGAAAVRLTLPPLALSAVCAVSTNPIRGTFDGRTVPAAATGISLPAGTIFRLDGVATLQNAQFIREGGADGQLDVEYFGPTRGPRPRIVGGESSGEDA